MPFHLLVAEDLHKVQSGSENEERGEPIRKGEGGDCSRAKNENPYCSHSKVEKCHSLVAKIALPFCVFANYPV
jgi:hypothetical protein